MNTSTKEKLLYPAKINGKPYECYSFHMLRNKVGDKKKMLHRLVDKPPSGSYTYS